MASAGGTEMLAEPAGVKAPGAWHPPKRPPTSAPAPLLGLPTAAPLFLSLPLLITCAGDLNSKYFVQEIQPVYSLFRLQLTGRRPFIHSFGQPGWKSSEISWARKEKKKVSTLAEKR